MVADVWAATVLEPIHTLTDVTPISGPGPLLELPALPICSSTGWAKTHIATFLPANPRVRGDT
jgi:hypothetical protein